MMAETGTVAPMGRRRSNSGVEGSWREKRSSLPPPVPRYRRWPERAAERTVSGEETGRPASAAGSSVARGSRATREAGGWDPMAGRKLVAAEMEGRRRVAVETKGGGRRLRWKQREDSGCVHLGDDACSPSTTQAAEWLE
jgi:hypothetical protein